MAYGNAQRLGENINPQLMQVDFSPYERAGATTGNAIANIGQQIGGVIKQYGDDEKTIKKSAQMAKSIRDAIPELAVMANSSLEQLSNPDLSQRARLAIAEGIQDSLKIGVMGLENNRSNATLKLQQDELATRINAAKNAPIPPPHSETFGAPGGEQKMIWNGRTGGYEYPQDPQGNNAQTQSNLGSNLPDALKPYVKDFESAGNKYGVPPNILAAISMHETGNGTSSAFRNKNNAMGVSNESGPIQMGSVPESIDRMARLLGQGINEGTGPYANAKSIEDIGKIYAPVGAGNDPTSLNQHWSSGVTSNIEKLSRNADAQGIADASQQRFGFKSDKESEKTTFRLATLEEAKQYGRTTGQMDSSGKFHPIDLPTGMTMESDGQGGFKMVQGSGVGGAKAQDQKEAGEIADKRGFNSVMGSASMVLGKFDKVLTSNPMLAKIQGGWAKAFPASESGQIDKDLENIRVQTSKASIFELKKLTGAVGQTTEKEWPKYESRFGDIQIGMNPDQIQRTIKLNVLNTFEAVYGSPDKMNQMLKDGKINQGQFNEYADSYLQVRRELQIPEEGVMGNSMDWSKLDKGILQQSTSRPLSVSDDFKNQFQIWKQQQNQR